MLRGASTEYVEADMVRQKTFLNPIGFKPQ
jgi:hypothetical protein